MTTHTEQVIEHLEKLAAELATRRFVVQVLALPGRAHYLKVINPAAPVMTEKVLTARTSEGNWAFHFPWPQHIAPIHDINAAADRIERVLAEVDR